MIIEEIVRMHKIENIILSVRKIETTSLCTFGIVIYCYA